MTTRFTWHEEVNELLAKKMIRDLTRDDENNT